MAGECKASSLPGPSRKPGSSWAGGEASVQPRTAALGALGAGSFYIRILFFLSGYLVPLEWFQG